VIVTDGFGGGIFAVAAGFGIGAAGGKGASLGIVHQIGGHSFYRFKGGFLGFVQARDALQQAQGIGMAGVAIELVEGG